VAAPRRDALRTAPYGVWVATCADPGRGVAAETLFWVMQCAFEPPMMTLAMPARSACLALVRERGRLLLHALGRGDRDMAYDFTRPAVAGEGTLSGHPYTLTDAGLPLLGRGVAVIECLVHAMAEQGDHCLLACHVGAAAPRAAADGRWDAMILRAGDMGEGFYYAG
jgi:flavin reductase (DIM6/NTAB) family NADH-FMN oxidoreductase RutF